MRELWPHQIDSIDRLFASLKAGHKRPMLASPTGSGKTVTSTNIVCRARAKGKRVVFIVPAISLINQTVSSFVRDGITDIGVIQANHPMTDASKPVQVASVQTLGRRKLPQTDLVLIDEAHILHETHRRILTDDALKSVPMIGLSATPWRKGLGKFFDDLIVVTTTQQLIDQGFLSPFRVFAPDHPDLSGVRTIAGDYNEAELAEAMNKPKLVADVVDNWIRHGEGRQTLCFAVDRAHAKKLQEEFERVGVAAGYIDCNVSGEDREPILQRFRRGDLTVICNVGTMTTGVDLDVRCLILARPTKSEMLFVQIIGRALRTAPGKQDAVIFDHSDTHARLGFVTDIHHDRLDDGRDEKSASRTREKPMPKECPKCHFLRPASVPTCPDCGFKPTRQCTVEIEDGELLELGAERVAVRALNRAERQRWYSMLLHIAHERNRQEGWAAHKFRERFKDWPNGLRKTLIEPDTAVLAFVKSTQIRWAKRRAA